LQIHLVNPMNVQARIIFDFVFFLTTKNKSTNFTWISFSARYQKYKCLSVNEIKSTFIVLVVDVDGSFFNEWSQRSISSSFIWRLVPNNIDFKPKPIDESNDDDAGRIYACTISILNFFFHKKNTLKFFFLLYCTKHCME